MVEASDREPHFNLWTEPWITVERRTGETEEMGIANVLLRAHELTTIYDPSPLVVAGIHRLLAAIVQAIWQPQTPGDLLRLRRAGCLAADRVMAFGEQYGNRFDLFDPDAPFLQSGDLALAPAKGDNIKSISQLTAETSRSTAIDHYRHGRATDEQFCPSCAARGLVTMPAFTSSGGAGLRPSINGVPPIYVLPGGDTLFESLAASVLLPEYQPEARGRGEDRAWWARPARVAESEQVVEVGYLHSLTFTPRRVRLHPERLAASCTRCGREASWGVRTMIFNKGEYRPKDAPFWRDPFAAYRLAGDKPPTPIRPVPGKVLWREYAGLFLAQDAGSKGDKTLRPSVLDQLSVLDAGDELTTWRLRCIGVRTDMKAKVYEWLDAGFEVPAIILRDDDAAQHIREALALAGACAGLIGGVFREQFGGRSRKQERHRDAKERMIAGYWTGLADPFRRYVLDLAAGRPCGEERIAASLGWAERITGAARERFVEAASHIGDDAANLRRRVVGEQKCRMRLAGLRKNFWLERKEDTL